MAKLDEYTATIRTLSDASHIISNEQRKGQISLKRDYIPCMSVFIISVSWSVYYVKTR